MIQTDKDYSVAYDLFSKDGLKVLSESLDMNLGVFELGVLTNAQTFLQELTHVFKTFFVEGDAEVFEFLQVVEDVYLVENVLFHLLRLGLLGQRAQG